MCARDIYTLARRPRIGLLMFLIIGVFVAGCGNGSTPPAPAAPPPTSAPSDDGGMGTLQFRANGEDFIREGMTTKDGWELTFDHVYVTLADITAYQADPPFQADAGGTPEATTIVTLEGTHTVDLAAGDEDAEPILIGEIDAPAGRYNAMSWTMRPATEGDAAGAVILLIGTAERDGRRIPFRIAFDQENEHMCGDYVGDERKGIVAADGTADLEATFHFDHLFGDGEAPSDDDINVSSLGFEPFARLATDDILDVDQATLRTSLSPEEYAIVERLHLAHVGEGHCTGVSEG